MSIITRGKADGCLARASDPNNETRAAAPCTLASSVRICLVSLPSTLMAGVPVVPPSSLRNRKPQGRVSSAVFSGDPDEDEYIVEGSKTPIRVCVLFVSA